ncbi:Alpha-L-arabinofuranosidase B (ABFB) domain-containing protein [Amycolatopsis pretoriensis]|uniref:Alpha-L-arabinofuranosidase B (ABFB) domain-containing protein n=1 Tax=Amycolatopsis pretoriensis TaxID=218821 RepID=A0A1H5RHK6_9PSEU|nr:Alpha-L-arabinofuranosidase B (ABFB) domain-containing protein [Amycolatopsis pretoriensis]
MSQRRDDRNVSANNRTRILRVLAGIVALVAASLTTASTASAAASLPCDIYGAAGTPCVAAHSTTRALYGTYNGALYQVQRASDGAKTNIGLLAAGGYANAAAQDSFCAGTTCLITEIYDQSPRHNDLTIEGPGGAGGQDTGVPADALPVTAGGHQVYGASFSGRMGYRDNSTSGVAKNGQPEGMYMITSGTHVNGACCFDYGNAETNNQDTGNGHMDALNFGTECWFQPCHGAGPWVQADLENGLFQSSAGGSQNTANTGITAPFVTALLKNNGQNFFALKDGNAQSGGLRTTYSGPEPTRAGYSPMHQEGAIVLGTGGDNSNGSIGSFFEGVMTAGLPTDAADNAVQANVVSVGYGGPTGSTGTLNPGSEISVRATTACCTGDYIRHQNDNAVISPVSSTLDKNDATWIVRRGLASSSCVSFESRNYPGDFLRHFDFQVYRQPMDGSAAFRADATFCPVAGKNGQGSSFRSYNYSGKYLRHYNNTLYIADTSGAHTWDAAGSYNDDVSWVVAQPWAP